MVIVPVDGGSSIDWRISNLRLNHVFLYSEVIFASIVTQLEKFGVCWRLQMEDGQEALT
jgi:hypothetical protein